MQWNLEWATAHSGVESRYNALYRDRQGWEARNRRTWPGRLDHDMARKRAMTWRSWVATRSRGLAPQSARAQGSAVRARGPGCWGIVSRYEWTYRDRRAAWPLGCIARQASIQPRTRPRYDRLCAQHGRGGCDRTRSSSHGGRGDTTHDTAHDTTECVLRHGQACTTTRPGVRYDTAGLGLRQGAVLAQCAQAGPRVGALCTRLSFDSVHCSESLFGTLFMSTVHEVLKKIK